MVLVSNTMLDSSSTEQGRPVCRPYRDFRFNPYPKPVVITTVKTSFVPIGTREPDTSGRVCQWPLFHVPRLSPVSLGFSPLGFPSRAFFPRSGCGMDPKNDLGKLLGNCNGVVTLPVLMILALIGQISLRSRGSNDCLGYTIVDRVSDD